MGQYHLLYNLDNKEYVHPHDMDWGSKQREHTGGLLDGVLYMLLTASPERGGGDLHSNETPDFKVLGRWCGQRVVVLGDYTENGDIPGVENAKDLYENVRDQGINISARIRPAWAAVFEE